MPRVGILALQGDFAAHGKALELLVHPQVAMRLLQEDRRNLTALEGQTKSKILVLSDPSLHVEEVKLQLRPS